MSDPTPPSPTRHPGQAVDLDEVRRRVEAATPGPWWDSKVLAAAGHHTIRGGPSTWRGFNGSLGGDTRPIARIEPAPDDEGGFVTNHDADAEFIAHARTDVPALLADLDAAREELRRVEPLVDAVRTWRRAELPPDAHNKVFRALNALAVAFDAFEHPEDVVDTYETQTGGTDG